MQNYTLEELKRFSPDELGEMVEEKEISWSEWVEAQPDTYDGYHEWLEKHGLERNDESAHDFIREVEETMMDFEKSPEVGQGLAAFHNLRRVQS